MQIEFKTFSALGLTLLLGAPLSGCNGKGADTGDTSTSTDSGNNSGDDSGNNGGGDDTGQGSSYFEPRWMSAAAVYGYLNGELTSVTTSQGEVPPYLVFLMANDEWQGDFEDTRNFCVAYFDASNATISSDFADSTNFSGMTNTGETHAWVGWMLPSDADELAENGSCDELDPAIFGNDGFGAWIMSFQWGFGMGPMPSDIKDLFYSYFGDPTSPNYDSNWDTYANSLHDQYLYTDYEGALQMYLDGGVVEELGPDGSLSDSPDYVDMSSVTLDDPAPDGYYVAYFIDNAYWEF